MSGEGRHGSLRPAIVSRCLQGGSEPVMSTSDEIRAGLTSDEDLQDVSVTELKPLNAPITLAEHDPEWPRLFAREADRIRAVLGGTVRRMEHVGSTSVPGLPAKP